ncbi:multicopper oxidase domain-containing protein [Pseudomonas gingeri]|uniref:Multicopper oxidase domain-containing protein n=1 Tax=Pseudomonas gingeri TaxID=117681 RepID=A0A7Y7XCS7_9PSED|nr:multicopper oxidase domain-containing protein [Pseudomonas gingeri]NWB97475.1 multicopper oxidase domain-containing protein [Pseudomonas gingeri]
MTGMHKGRSRYPYSLGLLALAVMGGGSTAQAVEASRLFNNPPSLEQQAPTAKVTEGTLLLKSNAVPLAPQPHVGRERQLDLIIKYTQNQILDPATGAQVPVSLRSYVGKGVNPNAPFIAPTIDATPGDTVRITLNNQLPADPSCTAHDSKPDVPHCFNGTNLHSHGLWVSPTGNSDNVLLSINPSVSFQYEYNIPADHPAGTFWYHPHRHGSTAIQVASGMAGALIIHGDRKPTPDTNGDIDTLLKGADGQSFKERLLVFQQIPYACKDAAGNFRYNIARDKDGKPLKDADGNDKKVIDWTCKPGEVGVVESFDQLQPSSWSDSGRYTSVNGLVQPIFDGARPGQVERWRLVHAGIRDTIRPMFRKLKDSDSAKLGSSKGVAALASAQFIAEQCTGEPVDYQVIASDGLTMEQAQSRQVITLQPGYRNDLLIVFPEPGRYCVTDEPSTASGGVSQQASGRQLLGFVDVGPGAKVANTKARLTEELVAAAERNMPADIKATVVADLKKDLRFDKFIPHPTIADSEIKGQQELVFLIDTKDPKHTKFAVGTTAANAVPYQPGVIDRHLKLGDAQTWVLQSAFASHPFHIHVNPFQIEKIIGPDGVDLSAPGAVDKTDKNDAQYAGMKGVWKDTLFVKGKTDGSGVYTLYVRTRYERYIGEFVLHCHILDHEDQGMMQNVSIELPDGVGGTTMGAHH